ncbi:transposase [Trichocoleus sp. FACHB-46]|nr:transposase [Trichocoleus sp. FACHB-46]
MVIPKGVDLVDVVLGGKGPRSDSKLLEQTQDELPNRLSFIGDRAYVSRCHTTTPHKKPPKGELTQEQKEFNRYVSQKRVFVEQVIRVIKIFQVAKEEFRMPSRMYEFAIGCACGLVRLRVQYV